ncbi:hypothetical protein ACVDFE_02925 [Lentzea chajnantorensis]
MAPEKFLGLTQTAWAGFAAIVSALALLGAVLAVLAAFRQVRAVTAAHEDQTRPYIVVDFENSLASWRLIDFVIKNIGQGPAKDVRIKMTPTPQRTVDDDARTKFADLRMLNEPIPTFAPGREFRTYFDNAPDLFQSKLPKVYSVEVEYGSHGSKKRWSETHILDLNVQADSARVEVLGAHETAKALRAIEKLLRNSKVLKGPVEVVTEEREVRRARLEAERAEYLAQRAEWERERQTSTAVDVKPDKATVEDATSGSDPVRGESVDGGTQGQTLADGD